VNDRDLVLIDTGIWSAFFTKPGSPEKHSVDILLDEDRVALTGQFSLKSFAVFVARSKQTGWRRASAWHIISNQPGTIGVKLRPLVVNWQPKATMFRSPSDHRSVGETCSVPGVHFRSTLRPDSRTEKISLTTD